MPVWFTGLMYQRMLTAEQSLKNDHYPFQERWVMKNSISHVWWWNKCFREPGIYKGCCIYLNCLPCPSRVTSVSCESLQGLCSGWPRGLLWFFGTIPVGWYWGTRLRWPSRSSRSHALCNPTLHTGCFRSRAVPRAETGSSPKGQWDCARLFGCAHWLISLLNPVFVFCGRCCL